MDSGHGPPAALQTRPLVPAPPSSWDPSRGLLSVLEWCNPREPLPQITLTSLRASRFLLKWHPLLDIVGPSIALGQAVHFGSPHLTFCEHS